MACNAISLCLGCRAPLSWSEKFFDEVGVRGEPIPRFSRFPLENRPFNSLRPRVCSDYFSLEDILVFWRSGAYKKYPRSYGADHRVCGDHCPTSGHSGPRTPVNDLKQTQGGHGISLSGPQTSRTPAAPARAPPRPGERGVTVWDSQARVC